MNSKISSFITLIFLINMVLLGAFSPATEPAAASEQPVTFQTPHAPILIQNNSQFNASNGVTNGSGTPADPYIIEGWNINASSVHGIQIWNTTAHAVIKNLTIDAIIWTYIGVYIFNASNIVIENITCHNLFRGIFIDYSISITARNNTIYSISNTGIILAYTNQTDLIGNNITTGPLGIRLFYSSRNNVTNNEIEQSNTAGIYIADLSFENNIENNSISFCFLGIYTYGTSSNRVINNTIFYNNRGIDLNNESDTTVSGNNVTANTFEGIDVQSCNNTTIFNNNISGNSNGIYFYKATNITVSNNNIFNNSQGLYLYSSTYNDVISNKIYLNIYGIICYNEGQFNTFFDNDFFNNTEGIHLYGADGITISKNRIYNNSYGIKIYRDSTRNYVQDNQITNNSYGIHLSTDNPSYKSKWNKISGNHIAFNSDYGILNLYTETNYIENNDVSQNYRGIYVSQSDTLVSNNTAIQNSVYGIYIYNSEFTRVINNSVSNCFYGIQLNHIYNSRVEYNIVNSNTHGFYIESSDDNILDNNTIEFNSVHGIRMYYSNSNEFNYNIISNNSNYGLYLQVADWNRFYYNKFEFNSDEGLYLLDCEKNYIYKNSFIANHEGVELTSSDYNYILYNNFIDNTLRQARDSGLNVWYNYPSGGNYWNDYTGVDIFSGISQNEPGSDSLGDSQYNIYSGTYDNYPLMKPYVQLTPSPPQNVKAIEYESYIQITWEPPRTAYGSNITNYRIYKGTTSGEESLFKERGIQFYYNDTEVEEGQYYYYRVSAVSEVGEGGLSSDSVARIGKVPGIPKLSLISTGNAFINLSIAPPSEPNKIPVTSYNLYRYKEGSGYPYIYSLNKSVTFFNDTSAKNGIDFSYELSAVNAIGEGKVSEGITARAKTIPGIPTNLRVSYDDSTILLRWSEPYSDGGALITNFRIYKGISAGVLSFHAEVDDVYLYEDTTVALGLSYFYRISAVNSQGEGELSEQIEAVIPTVPSIPLNLTATAGYSIVELQWEQPLLLGTTGMISYNIYRGEAPGQLSYYITVSYKLKYTDNDVINDITYYYKVSAENSYGEGPRSNEASATPQLYVNQAPKASIGANTTSGKVPLTVMFEGTGIDLDGSISSYRWEFGDGNTSYIQNPKHTFHNPGTFYVKLFVTDNNGDVGNAMITITVEPKTIPPVPGDGQNGGGDGDDDKEEGSSLARTVGIATAVIIAILVFLFIIWPMMLNRIMGTRTEGEEPESEGTPQEGPIKESAEGQQVEGGDSEPKVTQIDRL